MLAKRLFDIAAALAGLLVLAPLLLLLAAWIRCDSPGPVLFRQRRVGRHGVPFEIFKFRTMTAGAEREGQLSVADDQRTTRAGRWLRRHKLDELPQLLNVLRGDMSLVGPRPEVPRYVAHYPPAVRALVLSVAPGITDWAALRYRHEGDLLREAADPEQLYLQRVLPAKLRYYRRYVQRRSFAIDIGILLRTVAALLCGSRRPRTRTRWVRMHDSSRLLPHDRQSVLIDWLRGLAALQVAAAHLRAQVFPGLSTVSDPPLWYQGLAFVTGFAHQAVLVFFVLSGWLVGGVFLDRSRNMPPAQALRDYALDRATRLWTVLLPAFLLMLALAGTGALPVSSGTTTGAAIVKTAGKAPDTSAAIEGAGDADREGTAGAVRAASIVIEQTGDAGHNAPAASMNVFDAPDPGSGPIKKTAGAVRVVSAAIEQTGDAAHNASAASMNIFGAFNPEAAASKKTADSARHRPAAIKNSSGAARAASAAVEETGHAGHTAPDASMNTSGAVDPEAAAIGTATGIVHPASTTRSELRSADNATPTVANTSSDPAVAGTEPANAAALDPGAAWSLTTLLGNLVGLQTLAVPPFGENFPLWSLANETWYYVLFPLLVIGARSGAAWLRIAGAALATTVAILLGPAITGYFLVWLLGVAASRLRLHFSSSQRWLCRAALLVTAAWLRLQGQDGDFTVATLGPDLLLAVLLVGCLCSVGNGRPAPLVARIGAFLAGFSFTLYVVHIPLQRTLWAYRDGALLAPGDPGSLAVYAAMLAVILSLAYLFHLPFEAQTGRLRQLLRRQRSSDQYQASVTPPATQQTVATGVENAPARRPADAG
ncbi:sugar transferase [Duganella sp. Leaf126]|uniref:sugar transferase n=1 Tax=Duganella sp. Leaf126 TaxID=1736266 RepID=UPI0009E88FA5|nr:sugar transferase [Duganella sp. Leaf126]